MYIAILYIYIYICTLYIYIYIYIYTCACTHVERQRCSYATGFLAMATVFRESKLILS